MPAGGLDLARLPLVGRFPRRRHAPTAMRLPLLLLALLLIPYGLFGPQLSPKNPTTVLVWLHLRGLLILGLLLLGNLFCAACPFLLARDLLRRLVRPRLHWPNRWQRVWPAAGLLFLLLFAYELWDLWASPRRTALLILLYFLGAVGLGLLFRGAAFCRWFCPLGQFSVLSSTISPLTVQVRDQERCAQCPGKDCLRGREDASLPGCELGLFLPRKVGNLGCHLRLDCLRACPYDNVALALRPPAAELGDDRNRSVVGRPSRRRDLAALVALYVWGGLLNAFGMVPPAYALESGLADLLGLRPEWGLWAEAPVLLLLYIVGLVLLPLLLLGVAGGLSRLASGAGKRLSEVINRYIYSLLPLGFGIWAAHFAFHFLSGALTVIPVGQSVLLDLGLWRGVPRWDLGPILPLAWLFPLEAGLLGLGAWGSLLVAYRIAGREAPQKRLRAFLPWAVLVLLLLAAALWLMAQPMEMRGTIFQGVG